MPVKDVWPSTVWMNEVEGEVRSSYCSVGFYKSGFKKWRVEGCACIYAIPKGCPGLEKQQLHVVGLERRVGRGARGQALHMYMYKVHKLWCNAVCTLQCTLHLAPCTLRSSVPAGWFGSSVVLSKEVGMGWDGWKLSYLRYGGEKGGQGCWDFECPGYVWWSLGWQRS
jgi:hypothetical protein